MNDQVGISDVGCQSRNNAAVSRDLAGRCAEEIFGSIWREVYKGTHVAVRFHSRTP